MNKILLIQTAFIGDVILATALIESIYRKNPESKIDFLVRKGNEGLLEGHPKLNEVLVWDKKSNKYGGLRRLTRTVRNQKYDLLINLQRFGSSGYLSWRSLAVTKIGFRKSPFSFCYDVRVDHDIGNGLHEIERNHNLLKVFGNYPKCEPALYPSFEAKKNAARIKGEDDLVVMAPSSVWFTKQLPQEKWVQLIDQHNSSQKIVLIGAKSDQGYLDQIIDQASHGKLQNKAGELDLLESAALISLASMTYVNDSAPLHLASAMNAPTTVYFCSTVPDFGFGPLSEKSKVVQTQKRLNCRPCGLHGKKMCPLGHFDCGRTIDITLC